MSLLAFIKQATSQREVPMQPVEQDLQEDLQEELYLDGQSPVLQAEAHEQQEEQEEQQQHFCGCAMRLAKSAGLIAVGIATGVGGFSVSEQGRYRAPVKPLARTSLQGLTKLPAELPKFPVAFPIPPNNECGAAICAEGDLCCPGGPGYGYSCGTSQAVCCQGFLENDDGSPSQVSVAIVCGEKDVCCRNDDSNPYCCASGNQCVNNVCVASGGQCFPGQSTIQTRDADSSPLALARIGDEVLVPDDLGNLKYEPIMHFLHQVESQTTEYVTVVHEYGELRASGSHIAFVTDAMGQRKDVAMSQLSPGDRVQVAGIDGSISNDLELVSSRVLALRRSRDASGMYAPLSASGQVIVDGVVASCYAQSSSGLPVSHSPMHAAMFLVRVFGSNHGLISRFVPSMLVSRPEVQVGALLLNSAK
eukprot:TRINITY_DN3067_c1_g3_i1.p1 TRINITY_DN3067_c1_g3~~TRINITY_DN3067_c1_g3_i1.p1  ORF type:complete len:419 (-),score=88.23 TRINITY_DN3067_c1_g3_i1:252-1508(-)